MEMEREYEDWMNGIQNSKLYLRLYNIKSSVFVTVKSPVFVNVKPVPFNIVGGFIMSHPKVMILCTVHSLSESLCVISFNSM